MAAKKASVTKTHGPRTNFPRKVAYREEFSRILIVCEDSVTAPNYFRAMCDDWRISCSTEVLANVCVHGGAGKNAPQTLLKFIKKKIDESDSPYDRAYWVEDRDGHELFTQTLNLIKKTPVHGKTEIIPAHSIPCFEFWVLLHFEKTSRQFKDSKEIEKWLKKNYFSGYTKVTSSLYEIIKDKTKNAIANSKAIIKEVGVNGDNPSSYIHILVEDLLDQKRKLEVRK